MRNILYILLLFSSVCFGQRRLYSEAWGGGSTAKGAAASSNPVLIHVTTLNHDTALTYNASSDTYSGGIEAAWEANVGGRGRFIVFDVSGVIDGGITWEDKYYNGQKIPGGLGNSNWDAAIATENASEITVFGQTAPKGGITLYRTWLSNFKGQEFVIMNIAVRPGLLKTDLGWSDDQASTAIQMGSSRTFVGNCSASWGGDKGIRIADWQFGFPMQNMTGQYNMVVENATNGFTVDGKNTEPDWSVAGDLAWYRNWFVGGNRTPNMGGFNGQGEIMNNLIWYMNACCKLTTVNYGQPNINHIANRYIIEGNNIPNRYGPAGTSPGVTLYSRRNYYEDNGGVELDGTETTNNESIWINAATNAQLASSFFTSTPFTSGLTNRPTELTQTQLVDTVTAKAGVRWYMDNSGYRQEMQTKFDSMVRVRWASQTAYYLAGDDAYGPGGMAIHYYDPSTGTYAEESNTRPNLNTTTGASDYDTDADGLSDAWEIREFGDITSYSYADDPDGDGYLNIEEFVFQGDPLVNPDGGGGSPPPDPGTSFRSSNVNGGSGSDGTTGARLGTTKIKTKRGKPNG